MRQPIDIDIDYVFKAIVGTASPVLDVIMEAGSPADAVPQAVPGYWERPACASSRRLAETTSG